MGARWISVDGVAEYLGVSRDTIYAWLRKERVPGHCAGHLWKFKRFEGDAWLRAWGASNHAEAGTTGDEGDADREETACDTTREGEHP
ncbi:MAG: excisionase family DNA-binding protein [Acidobacteriota bacterium]